MFFFHATHVAQGYERWLGADAGNREKGAGGFTFRQGVCES
jgi:hypothetical protein